MKINKKEKFILDACCGRKAMWLNKNHPNAIFMDERDDGFISPDIQGDFKKIPYPNKTFKLIAWDPPHVIQGKTKESGITKQYGTLDPKNWREDLIKGFNECWRVLEDYGVLIFKWSNCDKWANKNAKDKDIIELFPIKPLFKQNAGKTAIWMCFMKIPGEKNAN